MNTDRKTLLVISDSHIPERAFRIDEHILSFIRSRNYDIVVHAGDLVDEGVLEQIKGFGSEYYVVQGNMDYLNLPEQERFKVYNVNIGVIHGDQVRPRGNIKALTAIAKDLEVDILISGHTHSPFIVFDPAGVLHINPGSVTGAWGGGGGSFTPSFIEIEMLKEEGIAYIRLYELRQGNIILQREERYKFSGPRSR